MKTKKQTRITLKAVQVCFAYYSSITPNIIIAPSLKPFWKIKQLMQQRGINNVDPVRVWVAMNADYSDRVAVNRKYGLDKPDYYLDAALAAWINDKDAVENKESVYYMYVVK